MKERLDAAIERALGENRIAGAVVLVKRAGETAYLRAAGLRDREAGAPMTADTIFRLASFTKPIVGVVALALVERGKLSLDDTVSRWLPDFRPKLPDGSAPEMTIRHLLTHTSGIAYPTLLPEDPYRDANISNGLDQPGLSLAENLRRLASVPLKFAPGREWRYGLSIDVLGGVLEAACLRPLDEVVREIVTGPLGMNDTDFRVTDTSRLAVPYADGRDRPIRMRDPQQVREDPATAVVFSPGRILDPKSYPSGGAGMAGTAGDFMTFLEMLRTRGRPILKPETVALASRNQIGDLPRDPTEAGWRFGLLSAVMDDPVAANSPLSVGTLDWGGVYGHRWLIDPAEKLSVVWMTNTAVEGVGGTFPFEIREAVYGRAGAR